MTERLYIIRRDVGGPRIAGMTMRTVAHRTSGYVLGTIGRHPPHDGGTSERWSAWLPRHLGADESALGELCRYMTEAADLLLDVEEHAPLVLRRKCASCRNRLWGWHQKDAPCPACETEAEAMARSRRELPVWWAHYDTVKRLLASTPRKP